MKWQATAPSNIALIKYMGKLAGQGNTPANSSLSYTLDHLKSYVSLELYDGDHDEWLVWPTADFTELNLSDSGKQKFLKHLSFLKSELGILRHNFRVYSANDFPSDCGLASSASSFAALTKSAFLASRDLVKNSHQEDVQYLANLSRQGSGSSIRSFMGPWVEWNDSGVQQVETRYPKLLHAVLVVEDEKKQVSSSEAHKRISSSLLFEGRISRADQRLKQLKVYLQTGEWAKIYQLCWQEFWDMHALFETSNPPFSYMTGESVRVLRSLQKSWVDLGDGPLVTMDAGANIHLLYRPEVQVQARQQLDDLKKQVRVIRGF